MTSNNANTPIIPQRQKRDFVVDGEKKPSCNPTKKDATESLPKAEKIPVPQKNQPGVVNVHYEGEEQTPKNKRIAHKVEAKHNAGTEAKTKEGVYSSTMKQTQNAPNVPDLKDVENMPISLDVPPEAKKYVENNYGKLNALSSGNLVNNSVNNQMNQRNVVDIPDANDIDNMKVSEPVLPQTPKNNVKEEWKGNVCTIIDGPKTTIREYFDDAHTQMKKETVKSGNNTTVVEYNQKTGKPASRTKTVGTNDMIVREQRDTFEDDGVSVSSTLLLGPGGKKTQSVTYKCGPNNNETHVIDYDGKERESQKTVTDSATDKKISQTTYKYAADGSRTESTQTF